MMLLVTEQKAFNAGHASGRKSAQPSDAGYHQWRGSQFLLDVHPKEEETLRSIYIDGWRAGREERRRAFDAADPLLQMQLG